MKLYMKEEKIKEEVVVDLCHLCYKLGIGGLDKHQGGVVPVLYGFRK